MKITSLLILLSLCAAKQEPLDPGLKHVDTSSPEMQAYIAEVDGLKQIVSDEINEYGVYPVEPHEIEADIAALEGIYSNMSEDEYVVLNGLNYDKEMIGGFINTYKEFLEYFDEDSVLVIYNSDSEFMSEQEFQEKVDSGEFLSN